MAIVPVNPAVRTVAGSCGEASESRFKSFGIAGKLLPVRRLRILQGGKV
jgi:hypothetical protein